MPITLSTAATLAPAKSPQDLLGRLLSSWGNQRIGSELEGPYLHGSCFIRFHAVP